MQRFDNEIDVFNTLKFSKKCFKKNFAINIL